MVLVQDPLCFQETHKRFAEARPEAELSAEDRGALDAFRANVRRFVEDGPSLYPPESTRRHPFLYGEKGC